MGTALRSFCFTGLIARVQAQGWVEGEDDGYGPVYEEERSDAVDADAIHPVVVKVR
jgi:hypothetical protein